METTAKCYTVIVRKTILLDAYGLIFQVCLVLDHLYDVPCKILNVASGSQLKDQIQVLIWLIWS